MTRFYEVNPADTSQMQGPYQLNSFVTLVWRPDVARFKAVSAVPEWNFYLTDPEDDRQCPLSGDLSPDYYIRSVDTTLVGALGDPVTRVAESVSCAIVDLDELALQKSDELASYQRQLFYNQARLSGLGGTDYWVNMDEVAQGAYSIFGLDIQANGYPPDGIDVMIVRVDNEKRLNLTLIEPEWNAAVNAFSRQFAQLITKSGTRVGTAIANAIDAEDWQALADINVQSKMSTSAPATYVSPNSLLVSGNFANQVPRGTVIECVQPSQTIYGRVESATVNGDTTIVIDFRNADGTGKDPRQELVNATITIRVDQWRWPEYQDWPPGPNG